VPRRVHDLERRHSAGNLHRRIREFCPSGMFAWFSSNSRSNGRGSLMIYRSQPGRVHAWYSSFDGNRAWMPSSSKGIPRAQLEGWVSESNREMDSPASELPPES
jgi:hypothetical protein